MPLIVLTNGLILSYVSAQLLDVLPRLHSVIRGLLERAIVFNLVADFDDTLLNRFALLPYEVNAQSHILIGPIFQMINVRKNVTMVQIYISVTWLLW
jgi:hypothetical protein